VLDVEPFASARDRVPPVELWPHQTLADMVRRFEQKVANFVRQHASEYEGGERLPKARAARPNFRGIPGKIGRSAHRGQHHRRWSAA
jgi:hypothetical protein